MVGHDALPNPYSAALGDRSGRFSVRSKQNTGGCFFGLGFLAKNFMAPLSFLSLITLQA